MASATVAQSGAAAPACNNGPRAKGFGGKVLPGPVWRACVASGYIPTAECAEEWRWHEQLSAALSSGGEGGPTALLRISVSVSGLAHAITFSPQLLMQYYLPLVVLLHHWSTQAGCPAGLGGVPARLLVGLVAPAGAGKSTLAALLVALGNQWWALRSGEETGEYFAALSMDAYHLSNAVLVARGLKANKGRIDTMDGEGFAADLRLLRVDGSTAAAMDATGGSGAKPWPEAGRPGAAQLAADGSVLLPEYDRAVTHDPVPGVVRVTSAHRVVLVEGLYLCAAGGVEGTTGAAAQEPVPEAWADVRAALDRVIFLDVPLAVCRERTVSRKVAGGVPRAESEAYYDRVDMPVYHALQLDKDKMPGTGPDLVLAVTDDGVLSSAAAGTRGEGAAISVTGATLRQRSMSFGPSVTAAGAAPHAVDRATLVGGATVHQIVILGLNPCVQRTLVFCRPPSDPANGLAPGPAAPSWERGEVNRASAAAVSVGGKGQHTALAVLRHGAHARDDASASARTRVIPVLFQFLGGDTGRFVAATLAAAAAAATTSTGMAVTDRSAGVRIQQASTDVGEERPTRTCVTLLDRAVGDMTELIEPSARVPSECVAALQASVLAAVDRAAAVAIMGTAPPGAEGLYADVASAAAAAAAGAAVHRAAGPLVLLDGSKGVGEPLATGGVTVLKVNADELAALAAQLAPDARDAAMDTAGTPACRPADARTPAGIVRNALRLLRLYGPRRAGGAGGGLRFLAITNGPRPAVLVQALPVDHVVESTENGGSTPTASISVRVWTYSVPAVEAVCGRPVSNPIGAGDTVAGVLLTEWLRGVHPATAFAIALAAGSASCLTLTGAEWHDCDAAGVLVGVTAIEEDVF
jgi:pantothenate kinase/fructose-1-phosphate kinase PfkB-like protein